MSRALELAKLGMGFVSPNPMVGAVIVKNNESIGEGYHEKCGGPHAEVNAIADAERKGFQVEGSTMYITLEPCAHQGKTPPCTDLILEKKIQEVVIAVIDPNSEASGGSQKLRGAGVQVKTGVLRDEAEKLNRFFFHFHQHKRPFFLGKSAVSQNGYVAKKPGIHTQISGARAHEYTHELRMECDAILIGAHTAVVDNPMLSVRFGESRRDPLRIILDPHEKIPKTSNVFRDSNYVLVTSNAGGDNILTVPMDASGKIDLHDLSQKLFQKNILSVLVEGGPITLQHFFEADLMDEFLLFKSEKLLPETGVPLSFDPEAFCLNAVSEIDLGEDEVGVYVREG